MPFALDFARRDLRASGRSLWIFRACLALGVALVAATGGLYQQVSTALLDDTRALMGGDVEVESRRPIPGEVLEWMRANGTVSRLTELRTMMRAGEGALQIVELQSVDENYPLYGNLRLKPDEALDDVTSQRDGRHGIALDPVLAERLSLGIGDTVGIGALTLEVRALIHAQPDRALSADWRGAPALISYAALEASGLVTPASRIEFEYRVKTDESPEAWRNRFFDAFPEGGWEVDTITGRSERIAERLAQVASSLLIIAFSTLFIGGLGVFNAVSAYLREKRVTIATLQALGLRRRRLASIYLIQVAMLAGKSSLAGAAIGVAVAAAGARFAAGHVPVEQAVSLLAAPAIAAILFGMLIALTFSMPALGRALSVDPATLFRGIEGASPPLPDRWRLATGAGCVLIAVAVLATLPDPLFGLGFLAVVAAVMGLLDLLVRLLRRGARRMESHPMLDRHFALRLAVANLHRPGSPLRTSLLSLGSALTLIVACAVVVSALLHTLNATIPDNAPALVLYDIQDSQVEDVTGALGPSPETSRIDIAPLVLGRLSHVNGEPLNDSADGNRRAEARDEHKLTYRGDNIDGVTMDRGAWWRDDAPGVQVVMEDRESDQLGLVVGDRLTFAIQDRTLETTLSGIYRQQGMQTRFWFEAIVERGALDPFIHRHVGAAWMDDDAARAAQSRIARIAPNVVTVRTADIVKTARELLGRAALALSAIAAISLAVSLLVLSGVMATSRARQVYEATILHSIGARLSAIRRSLQLEYLLLALITSAFAVAAGAAIAIPLVVLRLKIVDPFPLWPALLVAVVVSTTCLHLGARYLLKRLRLNPATLLRSSG